MRSIKESLKRNAKVNVLDRMNKHEYKEFLGHSKFVHFEALPKARFLEHIQVLHKVRKTDVIIAVVMCHARWDG